MRVIKQILDLIKRHKRFLITAHSRPDGDALGSELAFALMLKKMGKFARIVHAGGVSPEYSFLPGINMVEEVKSRIRGDYDVLVVLDSDGLDRLEKLQELLPRGLPIINIDHHPSNDHFGEINWSDAKMSSVGEMVYRLIRASPVHLDKDIAMNLYVSLITDTGHFCFASTTSHSHRMASELLKYGIDLRRVFRNIYENLRLVDLLLKSDSIRRIKMAFNGRVAYTELTSEMYRKYHTEPKDSQQYLNTVKSIKGIQVAFLFRETRDRNDGIKVSIRTEPPIKANEVAQLFGGGGHYRAAGCTIYKPLRQAQHIVLRAVRKFLV